MIKYIISITLFGFIQSISFFDSFIETNNIFLNQKLKCINLDYKSENDFGIFSSTGFAMVGLSPNSAIVDLNDYTFLMEDSVFKQYNKQTNQIFISNSDLYSIIEKLFSIKYLLHYKPSSNNYIIIPIEIDNQLIVLKIILSNDKTMISSIELINEKLTLYNIELLNECSDIVKLFNFDYPDAFILDLRD